MSAALAPLLSSVNSEWETPPLIFDYICEQVGEKNLELDVCAQAQTAKCHYYYSPFEDGLEQPWHDKRCWLNPPYGRQIHKWVRKAAECKAEVVVALLPARTDTTWWHRYVIGEAENIYFIWGRIKFVGAKHSAPFPSAVVVWRRRYTNSEKVPLQYGSFDAYPD